MNTLTSFHKCMKNQPMEKRKQFSIQLRKDVKPLLSCLEKNGVQYKIVGSVARETAHERSDVDVHIDAKDASKTLTCAEFTKKKSATDTCGIFEQYTTRVGGANVDLSFKHCHGTYGGKWNRFPHLDEEMKNIMFCTNHVLRQGGLKMAAHSDHVLNVNYYFHDVHAKEKLYKGSK